MKNEWIEAEAANFIKKHGAGWEDEVALLAYMSRLVGSRPDLAMHGGGNTSLKIFVKTLAGERKAALFVKASGTSLETVLPSDFVCLDLGYLKKLRTVRSLSDEAMAAEFRMHRLRPGDAVPSLETLMHAFLEGKVVVHTHPSSVLALTNRAGGQKAAAEALGKDVAIIPYVSSGPALGRAVADELAGGKKRRAIVVMHHGLITWGRNSKRAYEQTIDIVNRAEAYLQKSVSRVFPIGAKTSVETARMRYIKIAPLLRGLLTPLSGNPDNPHHKILMAPLISAKILEILDSPKACRIACTPPLTPDHLVRTKAFPMFVENPDYDDTENLRRQLAREIRLFGAGYDAYVKKHLKRMPKFQAFGCDPLPRAVLLPGLGAVCTGPDADIAKAARDLTGQALLVKCAIFETGGRYKGLTEDHLFDMEFRAFQQAKVARSAEAPLRGSVALVTGAAGAIGSAVCEALLGNGCAVAATDLAGKNLDAMAAAQKRLHGNRVLGIPLDVTDRASVSEAFERTFEAFGGIDVVIINAGLAHVSGLTDLELDAFRKLERVNVEGALLLLAEAGKTFKMQNTAGDIVFVSTKNVFAPGAKFGAYSATKAAAHQLCRIASIEFAEMGVRVNMVSPDAVFSHGSKKSGLWAQVGPDRMKARGLDEKGLEEYYRQRNLLKARVTAEHVARAVLFFVTRQTPTTGATIPVDGGLPDSTPR